MWKLTQLTIALAVLSLFPSAHIYSMRAPIKEMSKMRLEKDGWHRDVPWNGIPIYSNNVEEVAFKKQT